MAIWSPTHAGLARPRIIPLNRRNALLHSSSRVLASIALCAAVVLAAPLTGAAEPAGRQIFSPTPKGFGKPVVINHGQFTMTKGILTCSKLVIDTCMVANMPLLAQGDPKVETALQPFLQKQAVGNLIADQTGAKHTAADYAHIIGAFSGCYDTSIVTVINTALANRRADVVLAKRTKEFDDLTAAGELSKPEQQMVWKYQLTYESDHGIVKNGKVVQHIHFPEVIADIGGGIKEACDPYKYGDCSVATAVNGKGHAARKANPSKTELTDAAVKDLLHKGNIVLLAYKRYDPSVSVDAKTGVKTVTLNFAGLHKVVVSGFQPGEYGLLVNDVGGGSRHKVRLQSDLNGLNFTTRLPFKTVKYEFVQTAGITTPSLDSPFLVYEGEDKKLNAQVHFMDHYDTLQVAAK